MIGVFKSHIFYTNQIEKEKEFTQTKKCITKQILEWHSSSRQQTFIKVMTGKGSRRRPQSTDTPSMCVALTCCQYSLSTRGCTTERGDTAAKLSAPVVTPISSLKLYVVLSSVQFLALHPRLPAPVMHHPSPGYWVIPPVPKFFISPVLGNSPSTGCSLTA